MTDLVLPALSSLIERGATYRPQLLIGGYWSDFNTAQVDGFYCSCALGAAVEALISPAGPMDLTFRDGFDRTRVLFGGLSRLQPLLDVQVPHPVRGEPIWLHYAIVLMNDKMKLTRRAIAARLRNEYGR